MQLPTKPRSDHGQGVAATGRQKAFKFAVALSIDRLRSQPVTALGAGCAAHTRFDADAVVIDDPSFQDRAWLESDRPRLSNFLGVLQEEELPQVQFLLIDQDGLL